MSTAESCVHASTAYSHVRGPARARVDLPARVAAPQAFRTQGHRARSRADGGRSQQAPRGFLGDGRPLVDNGRGPGPAARLSRVAQRRVQTGRPQRHRVRPGVSVGVKWSD